VKVLFLPKYGRAGASSRYRIYAYLSHLQARDWQVDVYPLFRDSYVTEMYATGRRSTAAVAGAALRRAAALSRLALRQYDVIYIQYELFPYIPFLFERLFCRSNGSSVIVDYDDATFAMYEDIGFLKYKISNVMRDASIVVTGNRCLAEYASGYANEVVTIPTVVDLSRYGPKGDYGTDRGTAVVGWIGTPITVRNLVSAADAFQNAARRVDYRLRCVGAPPGFTIPGVKVEVRPWSEATEAAEIKQFDVGVMPLAPSLFATGKCGFKLIQYMGCGVPPVATAIGANCDIIRDGFNGFLASNQSEFADKLCALLGDAALRSRLGRAARETVQERYCLEVTAPVFCDLLERAANAGSGKSALNEHVATILDKATLSNYTRTE
jgi:glycosyltransferase involved in cell wall biosynthesis